MEMLCPKCMGTLVSTDGRMARCTLDGECYEILFSKDSVGAVTASAQTPGLAQPDAAAGATAGIRLVPPTASAPGVPAGTTCKTHPNVDAVRFCGLCSAPICATCDFTFPGDMHVCAECATKPQTLSDRRRKNAVWSIVTSACATFFAALIFAGVFARSVRTASDEAVLSVAMMFLWLFPAFAGLILGCCSFDRRRVNPPIVYVSIIWSGILIGVYLMLCVIGATK